MKLIKLFIPLSALAFVVAIALGLASFPSSEHRGAGTKFLGCYGGELNGHKVIIEVSPQVMQTETRPVAYVANLDNLGWSLLPSERLFVDPSTGYSFRIGAGQPRLMRVKETAAGKLELQVEVGDYGEFASFARGRCGVP